MHLILNVPPSADPLTITFHFAGGASLAAADQPSGIAEAMPAAILAGAAAEALELAKKAQLEQDMDYSDCRGFDTQFLGFNTPFPTLGPQLKRKAASLTGYSGRFTLNYYNYSTIQHAIRKMPVLSAINIDGNPGKRQDENPRKDTWMRDNRIDFDLQLTDAFYKKSGFDKGHMSRREDADWGRTDALAYRNANLTCMYTNACPQVPDLNRAVYGSHGLWGQLEQVILENGVEKETGKTTKICVYNGPIFIPTDPVFKGVQIPMRFFKVVVWVNAAGKKKTTAFILSQEDLVGGIQFEELQYNKEFKEHQCDMEFLESLTDLRFDEIRDWDTFVSSSPEDTGVQRLDNETLESLIAANQ